ncbi:MAG: TlpA disulfide reductase family protein, partial [Pirellula sp.]
MEREELTDLIAELQKWGLDSSFIPGVRPFKLFANTVLASAIAVGGYCSDSDWIPPDACLYDSHRDGRQLVDPAFCFEDFPYFTEFDDQSAPSLPIRIEQHFRDRLYDAELRDSWRAQGIEPPNAECYAKTLEVLGEVFTHFGFLPSKVETIGQKVIPLTITEAQVAKRDVEIGDIEIPCRIGSRVGSDMRAFKFTDSKGVGKLVNDMQGKYVLFHVWATWCGPCMASMPKLKADIETFSKQPLMVVGLNIDDIPAQAEKVARKQEFSWTQNYL